MRLVHPPARRRRLHWTLTHWVLVGPDGTKLYTIDGRRKTCKLAYTGGRVMLLADHIESQRAIISRLSRELEAATKQANRQQVLDNARMVDQAAR
jgi:hypothetical protein